eukprot:6214139-Pleurochrysis_carterae.AAC.3
MLSLKQLEACLTYHYMRCITSRLVALASSRCPTLRVCFCRWQARVTSLEFQPQGNITRSC